MTIFMFEFFLKTSTLGCTSSQRTKNMAARKAFHHFPFYYDDHQLITVQPFMHMFAITINN